MGSHPHPPAGNAQAGSPWPRYLLIGCGFVFVLTIALGALGFFFVRTMITEVGSAITSERALVVEPIELSPEEMAELDRRIREFGDALRDGRPVEPLVLTEDEINAQIQKRFRQKPSGAAAQVRIVGRQIEGEVSIPIRGFLPELDGRYLNGKAVFSVGVVDGKVVAFINDLRVGDRYIPDSVRERLSRENLLNDIHEEDEELSRALSRLESVEIGDGKVILRPAAVR
jgi:hypothetical protein